MIEMLVVTYLLKFKNIIRHSQILFRRLLIASTHHSLSLGTFASMYPHVDSAGIPTAD